MKNAWTLPSTLPKPSAYVTPAVCPACLSPSIVTKAKEPDAASYWRCTACGEVWNGSRSQLNEHGAYQRW